MIDQLSTHSVGGGDDVSGDDADRRRRRRRKNADSIAAKDCVELRRLSHPLRTNTHPLQALDRFGPGFDLLAVFDRITVFDRSNFRTPSAGAGPVRAAGVLHDGGGVLRLRVRALQEIFGSLT